MTHEEYKKFVAQFDLGNTTNHENWVIGLAQKLVSGQTVLVEDSGLELFGLEGLGVEWLEVESE